MAGADQVGMLRTAGERASRPAGRHRRPRAGRVPGQFRPQPAHPGGPHRSRSQAARREPRQPVCFEVDGTDPAVHTGWSVIVRGEVTEVTDLAELARLRDLPLRAWAPGAGRQKPLRPDPARGADRPPNRGGEVRPWEPRSQGKSSMSATTPVSGSGSSRTCPSSGGCSQQPGFGGPGHCRRRARTVPRRPRGPSAANERGCPRLGGRSPDHRRAQPRRRSRPESKVRDLQHLRT
jgi:hypothetical protein